MDKYDIEHEHEFTARLAKKFHIAMLSSSKPTGVPAATASLAWAHAEAFVAQAKRIYQLKTMTAKS